MKNNIIIAVTLFFVMVFLSLYLFRGLPVKEQDLLIQNSYAIAPKSQMLIDMLRKILLSYPDFLKGWLVYVCCKSFIYLKFLPIIIYGIILGWVEGKNFISKNIKTMFPDITGYNMANRGIIGIVVFTLTVFSLPIEYYLKMSIESVFFVITIFLSAGICFFIRSMIINKPF